MRNDSYNRDPEIFQMCALFCICETNIYEIKKTAYFIHCIKLSESMYRNINFPAVFYINGDKIPYMCLILLTIIKLIA